jgi:Zn-dependent alcohol dehydrogenase
LKLLQVEGVSIILGSIAHYDKVTFNPNIFLYGYTWISELFGRYKRKIDMPCLVEKYIDGVR